MRRDGFLLDHLAAIENLYLELGGVVQLHGIAVGGVEAGDQLVSVVDDAHMQARLLLFGYAVDVCVMRKTGQISFQWPRLVLFQGERQGLPGTRIIAGDIAAGELFDGSARADLVGVQYDRRQRSSKGGDRE